MGEGGGATWSIPIRFSCNTPVTHAWSISHKCILFQSPVHSSIEVHLHLHFANLLWNLSFVLCWLVKIILAGKRVNFCLQCTNTGSCSCQSCWLSSVQSQTWSCCLCLHLGVQFASVNYNILTGITNGDGHVRVAGVDKSRWDWRVGWMRRGDWACLIEKPQNIGVKLLKWIKKSHRALCWIMSAPWVVCQSISLSVRSILVRSF